MHPAHAKPPHPSMVDPLDLVAAAAGRVRESEAALTGLRRSRDRAIYAALRGNFYQADIAARADVSPQYVSKLARNPDKYQPATEIEYIPAAPATELTAEVSTEVGAPVDDRPYIVLGGTCGIPKNDAALGRAWGDYSCTRILRNGQSEWTLRTP